MRPSPGPCRTGRRGSTSPQRRRSSAQNTSIPVRAVPVVGEILGFRAVQDVDVPTGVGERDALPVQTSDPDVDLPVEVACDLDGVLHLGHVVPVGGARVEVVLVPDENQHEVGRVTRDRLEVSAEGAGERLAGCGKRVEAAERAED